MKIKPLLILAAIAAGSLLISFALQALWPGWQADNEPLHSAMEAVGGLVGLAMAFVLLQRGREQSGGRVYAVALGFLAMGILEVFHAVSPEGNGAVLIRSVASLLGGIGFLLVWLPDFQAQAMRKTWLPWLTVAVATAFGLITLLFPESVPQMSQHGKFTLAAVVPKTLACIFFITGAVRFLVDFRRSGRSEDYLFALLALLFGVAEGLFSYSELMDIGWWFWHVLRLATYLVVLWYVSRGYLRLLEEAKLAEVTHRLGDLSHDVKNMLTPVILGAGLMHKELIELFRSHPELTDAKAKASRELCNEVIGTLRDTARLIEDRMREIADCVKGLSIPPQFAPCRIATVVDSVLKILRLPAEEKGLVLRTQGLENLPPILADDRRLYNAFYNLVNNAIPETPPGGSITISAHADQQAAELIISVADTGRGMPLNVRESLFTQRAISRKPGGTGLGTKIVKDVVDAHGGQISVESQEGKGTTFVIRLPFRPLGAPAG